MRIVIFGTGGVGGYFGTRLAQAGADVLFIARGRHLDAICTTGLQLRSPHGDVHLRSVTAADSVPDSFAPDLVFMCTKTWQLEDAAHALRPALSPDTMVMPLLNGVEATDMLSRILGRDHVVAGLCGIIAYIESPGVIRHAAVEPFLKFGELDNQRTTRAQALLEFFAQADGIDAEIPQDIHAALWLKFLFVASTGGVGAVARAPMGIIREQPRTRRLLQSTMEEIFAIAGARGVVLPADSVQETLAVVDGLPASGTASMQRDLMAGRPSELEAQIGAIVRLAARSGIDAPASEFIYAALLTNDLRARGELEFPD